MDFKHEGVTVFTYVQVFSQKKVIYIYFAIASSYPNSFSDLGSIPAVDANYQISNDSVYCYSAATKGKMKNYSFYLYVKANDTLQ
jgi:hypothetical protein